MEPQVQNGIKSWQWVVSGIIVVVIIIVAVLVFNNKSAEPTPPSAENSAIPSTSTSDVNRVIMTDQYPGNVVYLSSVQTSNGAWVVIKKDASGKPGAVIGSGYAAAGTIPLKITLSEAMIDGGMYYAALYSGSKDKAFNATFNTTINDANGSPVMKVFRSSASANAEVKG